MLYDFIDSMAGGILQLVGKNIEDSILTDNPQITLFKTVYRRHTNYSKYEHKINFNQSLNFGTETFANLRKYGDLLNSIILVLELPQIDIVFESYTRLQVKNLLATYGITFIPTGDLNQPIDESELAVIETLIADRIIELESILLKLENMITILETDFDPDVNVSVLLQTVDQYFNDIVSALMTGETNNIFYSYTNALIADTTTPRNLVNSDTLQLMLFNQIREFNNGSLYFLKSNVNTYVDEIFKFISNIEYGKYNRNIYSDSLTTFNIVLDNIYRQAQNPPDGITPDTTEYMKLDSYKMYLAFLLDNRTVINNNTELERIKNILVDSVINNINRNYDSMNNFFNCLKERYRIRGLKPIRTQKGVNAFETSLPFILLNLVEDELSIDDDITRYFKYDTSLTFNHYYARYIDANYTNMLQKVLSFFQDPNYANYFRNDITTLWNRLSVLVVMTVSPGITDSDELETVYLLNFIPILVLEDIQKVILQYLETALGLSDPFYTAMDTELTAKYNTLLTAIESQIILTTDELIELVTVTKANKKSSTDVLITGTIRPEVVFSFTMVMDYINAEFQSSINTVIANEGYTDTVVINNMNSILASFFTTALPSYTTYKENGYRVYNSGVTDNTPVFDAAGIIWKQIQDNYRNLLNSTYHDKHLNKEYFENSLGVEFMSYLNNIVYDNATVIPTIYKIFDGPDIVGVDYYMLSSDFIYNSDTTLTSITNFIASKKSIFTDYADRYKLYKNILRVKDTPLNKKIYFFESTTNILNKLIELVQNNPVYGYGGAVDADLNTMLLGAEDIIDDKIAVNNIIQEYDSNILLAINAPSNPYIGGTELYDWYNDSNIAGLSPLQRSVYADLYTSLTINVDPIGLYRNIAKIYSTYNGFASEIDIYNYMKSIYLNNTDYVKNILNMKYTQSPDNETNIRVTYNNVYKYYFDTHNKNESTLTDIDNSDPNNPGNDLLENKLYTTVENTRTERPASFSWIKELGHFIIEKIELKIGDQIIDVHTGEWLHHYTSLTQKSEHVRGYNIMIGNVPDMTTFNTDIKPAYTLYIPLQFWFCRRAESSLPMTALHLTKISISVKLKQFDQIAKWSAGAVFKKKPSLDAHLVCRYVYLDTDERALVSSHKHEQLIEVLQYNGTEYINFSNLQETPEGEHKLVRKVHFTNPCKEIIWGIQDLQKVTDKQYHDYSYQSAVYKRVINMAKQIKFKFNGRDRQLMLDGSYCNLCVPYKSHTRMPETGKYAYNFALYPEYYQPSGSVNMSKIDDVEIEIILEPEVVTEMREYDKLLRIGLYASSYNVLRIFSGMAGLAFN